MNQLPIGGHRYGGHRRLRQRLDAFIDGELDEVESEAVARHLDECPGCSEVSRQIRRIKVSLRQRMSRPADPAAIEQLRDAARSIAAGAGPG